MMVLGVSIPVASLLVIVQPIMQRRAIARYGSRLVCWLVGAPVRVSGFEIPEELACVVVANHASYLDGIVLTAALPPRFTFLIKKQMESVPLAGLILRRLGSQFVDRDSTSSRHRSARRLVASATGRDALALFPEGTFDVEPGLKPFRGGAFAAAWRAGLPVVPVVIHGTRHNLPAKAILPVPGRIDVHVCAPIATRECASTEALIAASRRAILGELGEPDLDPVGSGLSNAPSAPIDHKRT
jgi:1-acyl-sn-glycerol-3-phosphate acyltransferase